MKKYLLLFLSVCVIAQVAASDEGLGEYMHALTEDISAVQGELITDPSKAFGNLLSTPMISSKSQETQQHTVAILTFFANRDRVISTLDPEQAAVEYEKNKEFLVTVASVASGEKPLGALRGAQLFNEISPDLQNSWVRFVLNPR